MNIGLQLCTSTNIQVFNGKTHIHVQCWHLISCTKWVGSPGIIQDCATDCQPLFWAMMLGWAHNWTYFDLQDWWGIVVFGLFFWQVSHGCLYNHALADARSTGAGIKCLYVHSNEATTWLNIVWISIEFRGAWTKHTVLLQVCNCEKGKETSTAFWSR